LGGDGDRSGFTYTIGERGSGKLNRGYPDPDPEEVEEDKSIELNVVEGGNDV
jgi:hypothetical protein